MSIHRFTLLCSTTFVLFLSATNGLHASELPLQPHEEAHEWWATAQSVIHRILEENQQSQEDLEQPKWYEINYTTIGRAPLIDHAMAHPLELPEIALYVEEEIKACKGSSLAFFNLADNLSNYSQSKDHLSLHDQHPALVTQKVKDSIATLRTDLQKTLPELSETIIALVESMALASALRDAAFADFTPEEHQRLVELLPRYLLSAGSASEPAFSFYTNKIALSVELALLIQKVRFEYLLIASARFYQQLDQTRARLQDAKQEGTLPTLETMLRFETPLGDLVLGSSGDDLHAQDAFLSIDFGGNDHYTNNAGATHPEASGASALIDLSGDDHYIGGDFSQGSGICGLGALVDLEGDDHYNAGNYVQGTALCGVGMLFDIQGNDTYVAKVGALGFALFGYGVHADYGNGADSYIARSMAIGAATTLGVGITFNQGGNDNYRIGGFHGHAFYEDWDSGVGLGASSGARNWPVPETFTLYGGIGVFCDGQGDDVYSGITVCNGAAYLFGLGICIDSGGDDVYSSLFYSFGAGCHLAAGIMIDKRGSDVYRGHRHNVGVSLDRSAGVFLDLEGNDTYSGTRACGYGVKTKGVGICVDISGDDAYIGKEIVGFVNAATAVDAESTAIFIDFEGDDRYSDLTIDNNKARRSALYAYGTDSPEHEAPNGPAKRWELPTFIRSDQDEATQNTPLHRLASQSTLVSYGAMDDVLAESNRINQLVALSNDALPLVRRRFIEALEILTFDQSITPEEITQLSTHLQHSDFYVRTSIARALVRNTFDLDQLTHSIIEALESEKDWRTRQMLVHSLSNRSGMETTDALANVLSSDPAWQVRQTAALIFGRGTIDASIFGSLRRALLSDDNPCVRARACDALAGISSADLPEGIDTETLRETYLLALDDESGWVRLPAARELVLTHERIEGVEALVPLTGARGVVKSDSLSLLQELTGHPYEHTVDWKIWWEEYGKDFNLNQALSLRQEIDDIASAKGTPFGKRAQDLRDFVERHPQHCGATQRLAAMLHSRAKTMLDKTHTLEDAAALAKEATELREDNWRFHDTLAHIYLALGEKDAALAAARKAVVNSPDYHSERRQRFVDRIEHDWVDSNEDRTTDD